MPARAITYENGDYRLELDGQFVGYARSYVDGERILDQIAFDQLADAAAQRDAQILAYSEAYHLARLDGRLIDAALYKRLGEGLIAEKYGMTVEQMKAVA